MWIILNKEFYDAELKDCRAVSAYDDLDNAKEGLKGWLVIYQNIKSIYSLN